MKHPSNFWKFLLPCLLGLSIFISCNPDNGPDGLIPEDGAPAITMVSPLNNNFLERAGEKFTVTFQLADNESLKLFRAVAQVYNPSDSIVNFDFIWKDIEVNGTNELVDFEVQVPNNYGPYFKVRFTCYALDSKGEYNSAVFWLSILPEPSDPPIYKVFEYEADTIFNNRNGTVGSPKRDSVYAFNFTARRRFPTKSDYDTHGVGPAQLKEILKLEMDVAESSGSQGIWMPRLTSPSNEALDRDSIFVITDASRFNYENATYNTIYRAYFSDPSPYTETPILEVGNYVIIKLIKSPQPQFAVMKITELIDDGGGIAVKDQIIFDYKVTSP